MTALTIREARHRDLAAIVALLADDELGCGRENPDNLAHYDLVFGDIEGDIHNSIMAAEKGGQILGCFQITYITGLSRQGATRALIEGVRTHKDARGQGIGEAMMKHAVDMARAKGCILVQLTSDKSRSRAHTFYERLGFKKSHEGFKLDL